MSKGSTEPSTTSTSLLATSEPSQAYRPSEDTSDYEVSLKLKSLQKYLEPLGILIAKCEEQVESSISSTLSPQKQSYFRSSLSNLVTIRSILQGSEFSPPGSYSRLQFLEKIENQLASAVQRLGCYYPCHSRDNGDKKNKVSPTAQSFDDFLKKNSLEEFKHVFVEHGISTVQDMKNTSEKDLVELSLPLGARNRILAYFRGLVDGTR
uniref:SAM domain-containing protein n=1 Tax=Vannella robusta TaxID=1487602 RepID=A0A7S4IJB5_9EUKA|mmetsp:Transcript_3435/g.4264  ORF Transcript_3435/g.4264 Transcript_3435/m.4264 type:complete len:208 (+) Transcript_3435:376-999(+)